MKLQEFKGLCGKAEKEPHILTRERPLWIFGAGNFGRELAKVFRHEGYQLAGFIETNPKTGTVLELPVRTWRELGATEKTYQLVIGIFNRSAPLDKLEQLARNSGFTDVFMPWQIYTQFEQDLGWRYWLSAFQVIRNALPEIESVWQSLEDGESRDCLLNSLAFRLGQHNSYASFIHEDNQYFNRITLSAITGKTISYLDGGAYNGDTYQELCAQVEVSDAWLFEPDPQNYRELVSNVRTIGNSALCMPCAISDSYNFLTFGGEGEGGAITETGSQRVMTVALDELFPTQRINMIKLDIEGAEISALRGAQELIRRSQPILALSLYHRPTDAWEIPAFVRSLCPNHRLYIRQHYCNSFDSVLYAIPTRAS